MQTFLPMQGDGLPHGRNEDPGPLGPTPYTPHRPPPQNLRLSVRVENLRPANKSKNLKPHITQNLFNP